MKKIDKSKVLSVKYKEWLDSLDKNNHPKYNSSSNQYYQDIKMSLLYCQAGLCAYTERALCDPEYISIDNWDDEKYSRELTKLDKDSIKGDLEHFDESLKLKQAWLWDNFFVVDAYNNCRIKGSKSIKYILKPDSADYDPYKYLQFDFETGVFFPNVSLSDSEKKDVSYMIEILGLNCISYERKKELELFKLKKDTGLEVEPHQYITAWKMALESFE